MRHLKNRAALVARNVATAGRTAYGKVAAGGTAMLASGMALASGPASPGAAITAELSGGKAEVLGVIAILAAIVGVLILWAYVRRAR